MENKVNKPFYNVGPGDFIVDFLEALGWTQTDLAEVTGLSTKSVNQLINNKQGITPETAVLLEKAFGTPASFWLETDAKYQIRKRAEQNSDKNELTQKKAMLRKYMPVSEMKKKGWFLYDIDTISGIEAECMRLFNQNTVPEDIYARDYQFCARQTRFDYDYTRWHSQTWFEYAKLHADSFELPPYRKEKLEDISSSLFKYTTIENGVEKVLADLKECGVGFFILSHLQKTYLDGAAFLRGSNPFIVYTARHDRIDNFWFVLAHEIAHILLHSEYLVKPVLDNLDEEAQSKREVDADSAAGKYLNQEAVIAFGNRYGKYLNAKRLEQVSNETNVSISVALGMLQHFGLLDWRQFSRYRIPAIQFIPRELIKG